MKNYQERLKEISDAAERQLAESMGNFKEDTLLDEGIEVEFHSDMNGIVGYVVRAFIGGRMYCSDEEGYDLEELKENYNALMTFDEMTPYGNCLLADGLAGSSYAEEYEAVYNEALKYLRSMPDDELVELKEPVPLSSIVDYDPWVDDFEYVSCGNREAYLEDDGFDLLENFLHEDLALLADKVKEVREGGEQLKCCIGTADLMAEFIDELFDDQEPKWNADNYVGFIGGDAVVLTYKDNRIIVKYTTGDMDGVLRAAQAILDECDRENPDICEGWKHKAFVVDNEVRLCYVK